MRERTRAAIGAVCAIVALGAALGGCNRPMTPREEAYGRRPRIQTDSGDRGPDERNSLMNTRGAHNARTERCMLGGKC